MRLSWKNMLISFALALVVLSVAMTVACVAIFNSRVDVRENQAGEEISVGFASQLRKYEFSDVNLYYDLYSDGTLRYVALMGICDGRDTAVITPIDKQLLLVYKDSERSISDIFDEQGEDVLSDIAAAVTGIYPEKSVKVEPFGGETIASEEEFVEQIHEIISQQCEKCRFEQIDVVLSADGSLDYEKTKAQFFYTDSIEK